MARHVSVLALILALQLQPVAAAAQAVPPSCPGTPGQGVAMADLCAHGPNRLIDANYADPDGREQPGVHKRCLYVTQVQWQRLPNGDERPRIPDGTPAGER